MNQNNPNNLPYPQYCGYCKGRCHCNGKGEPPYQSIDNVILRNKKTGETTKGGLYLKKAGSYYLTQGAVVNKYPASTWKEIIV